VLAKPEADTCLVIPNGFEQFDQENLSRTLPASLDHEKATIEILWIQRVLGFAYGSQMIFQASGNSISLFKWIPGRILGGISLSNINRGFRAGYWSIRHEFPLVVQRIHARAMKSSYFGQWNSWLRYQRQGDKSSNDGWVSRIENKLWPLNQIKILGQTISSLNK